MVMLRKIQSIALMLSLGLAIHAQDSLRTTADSIWQLPRFTPPAAWLAEASFVVTMDNDMQFGDVQSVANTSLAWGTFNNKLEEFSQNGGLNWSTLHQQAAGPDHDKEPRSFG